MVYTALQFITRGREHGISIVDLGKKTGYDQKTCFYLIKQLLELELVLKLRRGGVGNNFCIHKYFFERSPLWRQIQDEGVNPSKDIQAESRIGNEETSLTRDGFQAPVRFDPIEARHLSSLSLLQSRIVKLLKHSEYHTHPSQNLLVTIVSKNPLYLTQKNQFEPRLSGLLEPYQN
jgi:transcription factor C subunit 3